MSSEKTPETGMTFVDVGSESGLVHVVRRKACGRYGVVVSIEPSNREFKRLKKNLEVNRLTNVRLLQTAVSNCSCEADSLDRGRGEGRSQHAWSLWIYTVLHSSSELR